MTTTDLHRLLLNLVRKGTVIAVDHAREVCRVECGELQTNWIHWLALAAGDTRDWNPPEVGEQVLVLSPGGEMADGVALRGISSEDRPAPSHKPSTHTRTYPDGAVIEYDHETHGLTATLPNGGTVLLIAPQSVEVHTTVATIVASDLVRIDAPRTEMTGDLQVAGAIGAGKNITTPADVKAGNVSLATHKHMEQGDGKPTGGPI